MKRSSSLALTALVAMACGDVSRSSTASSEGGSTSTSVGSSSGGAGPTAAVSSGGVAATNTGAGGSATNGGSGARGGTGSEGAGASSSTGGASTGGTVSTGGTTASGGVGGATGGAGGATGGGPGTGGAGSSLGPCDIYEAAGTPCVAAYSMVRRLSSAYEGPLYQVRSGSSDRNTGFGGETHDIGMTPAGFGDAAGQDAVCADTFCTVSVLYDQSGRENHLVVSERFQMSQDAIEAFESHADAGPITVGGHDVYSLFMEFQQGYRLPFVGNGVPVDQEPQGIYMLVDGARYGANCCWDFGNGPTEPSNNERVTALFFGVGYWGSGAGEGPWFLADFADGFWAGGSSSGDPGWGQFDDVGPPNPNNPSLEGQVALGFLKTDASDWALRVADAQSADGVTTAYAGGLPVARANAGGVILGLGGGNAHNSFGTFFEGAIVAGWPSDEVDEAILEHVQSVGYW